jgi:hypothetical protein
MDRAPKCPFDPPPTLARSRDEQPVSRVRLWDGSTPWLITRFDDVRSTLADPRVSSDTDLPGYPQCSPGTAAATTGPMRTFISMDGQERRRVRHLLTADFTVRRMKALRPRVQGIVIRTADLRQMVRMREQHSGAEPDHVGGRLMVGEQKQPSEGRDLVSGHAAGGELASSEPTEQVVASLGDLAFCQCHDVVVQLRGLNLVDSGVTRDEDAADALKEVAFGVWHAEQLADHQ